VSRERRGLPRIAFLWLGAALLVAAAALLALREEAVHRTGALQQAQAQSDVLAGSVSAALAFDDAAAMRQYLGALMRNPQVAAAAIYGAGGERVASMSRPGAGQAPPRVAAPRASMSGARIVVVRPVTEQGQRLGFVYLRTVPETLAAVVARHLPLMLLTALALALLGLNTGAAARLADANLRLTEEIAARGAAEAALRQSQKLEALGQLTGGIAHDFNNLLQAIHGAFELVLGRASDEKTVRRWAANGLAAAERGASLTRQLLAFSRQQKLELKPLIVAGILGRMRDLLEGAVGPLIELILDLDESGAPVMSDATQLELAVMNLAANARDAMPAGGRLTIQTRSAAIEADAVLAPGRYLELRVIDSGEGMPPHVLHRAFEPFFTTKPVGKGTGLGLAQVYGLARQAGGDARIASTPGGGATVTLYLREAAAAAQIAPAAVRGAGAPGPALPATVLLVDDDEAVRGVVRGGLEMRGYRVLDAASGASALALAAAERPQIAVIDYAMPGMDGAETAERLRAIAPGLPIILASGYADTAAVEKALGEGARLMRKPFDLDALSSAVGEALAPVTPA